MKTYDFKNVTLTGGIYTFTEFDEGGISWTPDHALYTKKKGAGGEISRSKATGLAGKFKVSLKQTSAANAFMNALYLLDQSGNAGAVTWQLKDNSSDGTLIVTPNGWVETLPELKWGEGEDMIEWSIDCDNCVVNILGFTL